MSSRFRSLAAFLVLLASILFALPVSASAEFSSTVRTQAVNVMFVIDNSGSLHDADDDNLRLKVIDLFLALLPDSGNYVGTVVFGGDVQSDPEMYKTYSWSDKKDARDYIGRYQPGTETNIGSAVLAGVESLAEQENDLPRVLILVTDGQTALYHKTDNKQAEEDAEDAIELARKNNIVIFSIMLEGQIAPLNMPTLKNKMQRYADKTGGDFLSLQQKNKKDMLTIFSSFFRFINGTEYSKNSGAVNDVRLEENGRYTAAFTVPASGIDEVSIIIRQDNVNLAKSDNYIQLEVKDHTGTTYDLREHEVSAEVYSDRYLIATIPKPQNTDVGEWTATLKGQPYEWVHLCILDRSNLSVQLNGAENTAEWNTEGTYRLTLSSSQGYPDLLSGKRPEGTQALLHIYNKTLDKTYPDIDMSWGEEGYFAYAVFEDPGNYTLSATLSIGDVEFETKKTAVNGIKAPPPRASAKDWTITVDVDKLSYDIPCTELFIYPENAVITYSLSDYYAQNVVVEQATNGLKIYMKDPNTQKPSESGNYSFELYATDSDGRSATVPCTVTITQDGNAEHFGQIVFYICIVGFLVILICLVIIQRKNSKIHNISNNSALPK